MMVSACHSPPVDFKIVRDLILSSPDCAARYGETEGMRLLGGALARLTDHRAHLSEADDHREMNQFRELLLPLLLQSEFGDYVFRKLRSYPGNFVTQGMIWSGRTLGERCFVCPSIPQSSESRALHPS